jgi:hypothetical protein
MYVVTVFSCIMIFLQVNPKMVSDFERAGLSFVGKDESGSRMEVDLIFLFAVANVELVAKNLM